MKKTLIFIKIAFITTLINAQSTTGLVSYYSFNDGTVNDNYGNNNGTISNALITTDQYNNDSSAFDFNGVNGHVNLGADSSLKPSTATISLWAKLDAISNAGSGATWNPLILAKNNNGGSFFEGYALMLRQSDRAITAVCTNDQNNSAKIIYSTAMPTNEWTHLTISYDDDSLSLYINGDLYSTIFKGYTSTFSPSEQVRLGRMLGGSNERYFDGKIDEVRIYNRVLNDNEIKELSNLTNPKFSFSDITSSNNSPICNGESAEITVSNSQNDVNYYLMNGNTIHDGPILGNGGNLTMNTDLLNSSSNFNIHATHNNLGADFDSKALTFDGINDYVSIPLNNDFRYDTSYTIETWIKSTHSPNISTYYPFVSIYTPDSTDIEIYLQNSSTNDIVVAHNRGKISGFGFKGYVDPPNNDWYHLAVTFDGNNISVYYNGKLVNEIQSSGPAQAPNKSQGAVMTLGTIINNTQWAPYNSFYKGSLDNLRIWGVSKSQSEIQENMYKCLSGDENGLIYLYKFDQENTSNLVDYSTYNNNGIITNMDTTEAWINSSFSCGQNISTFTINVDICLSVEQSLNNAIEVYPNPAINIINIESSYLIENVLLSDINGKNILSTKSNSINISTLKSGVYIINVKTKNNQKQIKIIKK